MKINESTNSKIEIICCDAGASSEKKICFDNFPVCGVVCVCACVFMYIYLEKDGQTKGRIKRPYNGWDDRGGGSVAVAAAAMGKPVALGFSTIPKLCVRLRFSLNWFTFIFPFLSYFFLFISNYDLND